jgi:hypothetical protein
MKPRSHLLLAVYTLLLAIVASGLFSASVGTATPASALDEIPPGLSPVSYLPYLVLEMPPVPIPRSFLPYVLVGPTPTPTPTATPTPSPTPTPTPVPSPGPVGLKVYDMYGVERTYQWAVDKYGVHVEQISGWAYHCVELRERTGPSSVDVWVYQSNGSPAVNVRVEFYWPSGMDVQYTEASGRVGFAYGPGSYIYDPAVGGPHWLVVKDASSCDAVSRLGMLAGTPHDHLDVSYKYGYLSP